VQGTVKWFNNSKGYGFIGREDGPDVFVPLLGLNGRRLPDATGRRPVEFEIVQGTKGTTSIERSKKQGESGLHYSAGRERPPFWPFLFLRWTAAAIAKTAGFSPSAALGIKKPALQLPSQLKTEKEFPFIIGAWTTNRLHGFGGRPHNCWKSTARSSDATAVMRRRRS